MAALVARAGTAALRPEFLPRAGAEAIASPRALPDRPPRTYLPAARAVLHLGVQQPALPGVRELGGAADRLLPAAVDHPRLRGHVGLLEPCVRLRVVHRRPGVLLRPRLLLAGRAPPPSGHRAPLSSCLRTARRSPRCP